MPAEATPRCQAQVRQAASGQPPPAAAVGQPGARRSEESGRYGAVRGVAIPLDTRAASGLTARLAQLCARRPEVVNRAMRSAAEPHAAPAPAVQFETIAADRSSDLASRLRLRALNRTLDPLRDPAIRATLARYADGSCELYLVGQAAMLSRTGLLGLARELAGGPIWAGPIPAAGPEPVGTPDRSAFAVTAATGTGPRADQLRVPAGAAAGDQDLVVAAVATVAARFAGSARITLTVQDETRHPTPLDEQLAIDIGPEDTCAALAMRPATPRSEEPGSAILVCVPSDPVVATAEVVQECRWDLEVHGRHGELLLHYRADLIECRVAQAWAQALSRALDFFQNGRTRHLRSLTLAGEPVRRPDQLPAAPTVPELIERLAREEPEAVAVTSGREQLTRGALQAAAAGLARELIQQGVRQGDRVAVLVTPSQLLVVALLGVWMAGAAYVPLDPSYPQARLRYIVEDAGLAAVVRDQDHCLRIDPPLIDVDLRSVDISSLAEVPDAVGLPQPDPAAVAYVIYTSGSTGKPKGVEIAHRNIASLIAATSSLACGPADVWTLFHSYAFDFAVWEIWGCLARGGRLVVVPPAVAREPSEFYECLRAERVTVLNQTPSAFSRFLQLGLTPAALPDLRMVIFGGESLDCEPLLPWFDGGGHPELALINMYGITETTVHTTLWVLNRADALVGSRSVGRPLPGWQVSVRDSYGHQLPDGVPGEIWVSGAGVGVGYLNRPELTAERFLDDPEHGLRHYRSGDRGRILPDGELEHLGRLDDQVKIRGYRIELGEIRAALLAIPGAVAATVVVRGQGAEAAVDAYLVSARLSSAEIRERLRGELPEYLVPTTITVVPSLPRTANGKVDVARLPAPAAQSPSLPAAAPASATLLDQVHRIWQELLGADTTPDDNLFLVGGNSLLAHRLVLALQSAGFTAVRVRDVYQNPTARRLAEFLQPAADPYVTVSEAEGNG